MDIFQRFQEDVITNSPDWVLIWMQVMVGVLSLSILFSLVRPEARAILVGTLLGMAMTIIVYAQFGFTRMLGVGHVLFWTPTLVYMLSLQGTQAVARTWFGRWLWLAILVMTVSLGFDYYDLVRYLLGDRVPISIAG